MATIGVPDISPLTVDKDTCYNVLNLYEEALMSVKSLHDMITDDDLTEKDMPSAINDVLTNIQQFYTQGQANRY